MIAITTNGKVPPIIREVNGAACADRRVASGSRRGDDSTRILLLRALSHDLVTPITAILGASATLRRRGAGLSEAQQHELLQMVESRARGLGRIVSDLLDFDRLTDGQLSPQPEPTLLGELVRVTLEMVQLDGRMLHIEVPKEHVYLDRVLTSRIIANLIANAHKHTPLNSPIWVRASNGDGQLLITVEDAGDGIPDGVKDTIFEPFERNGNGPQDGGSGLGLFLVAGFAEVQGGRAWVEDKPGGGASFRVLLPAPHHPTVAVAH